MTIDELREEVDESDMGEAAKAELREILEDLEFEHGKGFEEEKDADG